MVYTKGLFFKNQHLNSNFGRKENKMCTLSVNTFKLKNLAEKLCTPVHQIPAKQLGLNLENIQEKVIYTI